MRPVKRDLGQGYELDDDPARIDVDAVHAYLTRAYWAIGRTREEQVAKNAAAARLVGLYASGSQVGFTRTAVVPGMPVAFLCEVWLRAAW